MLLRNYIPALKYGAKIIAEDCSGVGSFDGMFGTKVWYVDGVNGSDTSEGNYDNPFATIQAAVTAAGIYDTIYVRPKYAIQGVNQGQPNTYVENIVIPVTKTGLKIIGTVPSGDPYLSVKIKPTNTADHFILVNAAGVLLENLCIMNQALSLSGVFLSWQGKAYNVPATSTGNLEYVGSCGATIRNCEFREGHTIADLAGTTGTGCGPSIIIRGGYNSVIDGCSFVAGSTHTAIQLGDNICPSRNHKIVNCDFHDNNGAVADCYITTGSGAIHGWVIRDCTFGFGTLFIHAQAGNSGIVSGCTFSDATAATTAGTGGKLQFDVATEVTSANNWGGDSLIVAQYA